MTDIELAKMIEKFNWLSEQPFVIDIAQRCIENQFIFRNMMLRGNKEWIYFSGKAKAYRKSLEVIFEEFPEYVDGIIDGIWNEEIAELEKIHRCTNWKTYSCG